MILGYQLACLILEIGNVLEILLLGLHAGRFLLILLPLGLPWFSTFCDPPVTVELLYYEFKLFFVFFLGQDGSWSYAAIAWLWLQVGGLLILSLFFVPFFPVAQSFFLFVFFFNLCKKSGYMVIWNYSTRACSWPCPIFQVPTNESIFQSSFDLQCFCIRHIILRIFPG